jgi:glycosyltransferase involved in cell wall biosynthesis
MKDIAYSTIIPTYNRVESLGRALSSLIKLNRSDIGRVEVVVVDNNSTDHTLSLASNMINAIDVPLVYAFQPILGTNYACNSIMGCCMTEFSYMTNATIHPPD